jgi:superfamily II DNA or RNA helicase
MERVGTMNTTSGPGDRTGSVRLRPYQIEAINKVYALSAEGVKRIVIALPTGGGKTTIAAKIIERALKHGQRVLFLAHRRELISQAYQRLVDIGIPEREVGIIMATDPRRRPGASVQVASVDTLRNRPKPRADIVFVDECHRALATTYRDIAAAYPDALHLGLTATPYRADGKGLGDAYDEIVVVATPRQLINDGFLVEPRIFTMPPDQMPDLSRVKLQNGDYATGELGRAMDKQGLVGNIVEHWLEHAGGVRTVAFASSVAHSKHIAERFVAAGVPAEHLDGETPTVERDAILRRLESGETRVVSNMGVLCLGADTEILTRFGWANRRKMMANPTLEVANWADGKVYFAPPAEVLERERLPDERMVRISNGTLDLRVTEGHALVYRKSARQQWKKAPARDLVGQQVELPTSGMLSETTELHGGRSYELKSADKERLDTIQAAAAVSGLTSSLRPVGSLWELKCFPSHGTRVSVGELQFEEGFRDEVVWCVRTSSKNIITRRNGRVVVMGNCEGWDQPSVKCAILARPTKSTGLYLQQAGRILRPWDNHPAVILDHAGCALEHGLPQDTRQFALHVEKKRRNKDAEAPAKQCESCNMVVPLSARICPHCGEEFPRIEILGEADGKLIEFTPEQRKQLEWQRLLNVAADKGYRPGWAYYRYRDQFNEDPPDGIHRGTPTPRLTDIERVLRDAARRGSFNWGDLPSLIT